MSCLAWNCCGLGNWCARIELEELIQAKDPLVVFLSETWSNKDQLEKIRCNIKYAGLFVVQKQDVGGGLTLLWKHGVTVWVDSFSRFHIAAIVHGGSADAWRFTGFYGAPNAQDREDAWAMMRLLNSKPHLPWLCMGDFNEILFTEEKRGGRIRPHCQIQAFRDTLDVCGFVDLIFTGSEFTWNGNRHGHIIWERLDRGVANHDWLEKIPTATI